MKVTKGDKSIDPSDLWGMWKDNPQTIETMRQQAWRLSEEIPFLVLQIGKINKLIQSLQTNNDKLGVWQYSQHWQQFVDQLNSLLAQYHLRISVAA